MAENETKLCNNCKKQIAASNFMMHEMHCKRHIALCEHCQEPIPKGEMSVHFEENHAMINCPKCNVEVEKMKLEEHEENECAKRPMKCVYCQLEVAKDAFNDHIDYCGSRTEQCPKCAQYVKLKDQNKHEDSDCHYPEIIKPKNTNQTHQNGVGDSNGDSGFSLNPFAFDELSRVMGRPRIGLGESAFAPRPTNFEENLSDGAYRGVARTNKVSNVSRQTNGKSNLNRVSVTKKTRGLHITPPSDLDIDHLLAMQLTQDLTQDEDHDAVIRAIEKPSPPTPPNQFEGFEPIDRNTFYEGLHITPPSDLDIDHLLAMQLTQDLTQDEDHDAVIRAIEKPSPPTPPNQFEGFEPIDRNTFYEDLVLIPCEFCGEPMTSENLVQHQSRCSLDRISEMLPKLTSSLSNNARTDVPVSPALVDPPSIIDNLRPLNPEWLDDTAGLPNIDDDADELMLPCEFCDDLFPMDTLIQHQAICDQSNTMTPRVTTPVASRTRKKTTGLNLNHGLAEAFPNLSSRRHQPPPSLSLDSDSEDDTVLRNTRPKYTIGASSHRVRKPNTTTIGKNKDTSSSGQSPTASVNSMLRKYGIEGENRGDYYSRRGSQHSRNSDNDSWLQSNAQLPKKRTGSGARTRDTLNSLLNETGETSSHDLLGHIGGPKTRKNESNVSRQRVSVVPASRNVPKVRNTVTNARDVQRELRNTGPAPVTFQHPRNRTNKPNIEVRPRPAAADEISDTVLSNQRSRAQVFGARNTKPSGIRRKPEGH